MFKDYEISCLTSFPDLFTHLPFKRIYHKDEAKDLNDEEWLVLHTNPPHENMARDFITHHFTQVVDFSTLCAFQRQIPIKDRQIMLPRKETKTFDIVIHPGRHWTSKTFPKEWWNEVILGLSGKGKSVAIVGKDDPKTDTGTVDVIVPEHVVDLRNKLSLPELVWTLNSAKAVLTNDSAPLHMATIGEGWVFFIASCKEADHLMHWRRGVFGWRMENLGLDGLWNHQDSIPIRDTEFRIDHMEPEMMKKVLPPPEEISKKILRTVYWGFP